MLKDCFTENVSCIKAVHSIGRQLPATVGMPKNCSRVKRTYGFRDISLFLSKTNTFLQPPLKYDSPYNRITLRAETGSTSHFMKISILGVMKNLSLNGKFSQGMQLTQRMHFWIAYDLRKAGKLVWCETNSGIERNIHFCNQNKYLFLDRLIIFLDRSPHRSPHRSPLIFW